jgi:holin-like protein
MLFYITLIFFCQLIGEMLVAATDLSVPGPVIGMLLLFTGLLFHGSIPDDLATVADSLLTHLSLLFVPAGVGILLHSRLLANELIPITVSLVVSTILTIGVTGILMAWLGLRFAGNPETADGGNDS